MANTVGGTVVWNLDVDSSKLSQGLSEAKSMVDKTSDEIDSRISGLSKSVVSSFKNAERGSQMFATGIATLGTAIIGTVGFGAKVAGDIESMTIALETVTGSKDQAIKAMDEIRKTATESPFFEVKPLAEFVQLMVAAGQDLPQALKTSVGFGDIAAAFGKNTAEMTRMGNTVSQVIGKGKADMIDFRELVNAGWVSVRKDTAEAMGVSMAEFENLVSAGKVGYAEIAKAGEKYTGAAMKQANTFGALINRLKETFSTILSDIVIDTGAFDKIKEALATLEGALSNFKPQIIEFIISSVAWMNDNFPMLAGAIIGGLTPAFVGLAVAIGSALAPLVPFIVVGGLLGVAIDALVKQIGGWDVVLAKLSGAWTSLNNVFNQYIRPSLEALIKTVKENLLPSLQELWTLVSPILIPVLKAFAGVFAASIVIGVRAAIDILRLIITVVSNVIRQFSDLINMFKEIPNRIRSAMSGVVGAITGPFNEAYDKVKDVANKIKGQMDKVSPFHRNSPSLIDNVTRGVDIIKSEFGSLKNIAMPQVSGMMPSLPRDPFENTGGSRGMAIDSQSSMSKGTTQNISIEIGQVGSQEDIQSLVREMGFRTMIQPEFSS